MLSWRKRMKVTSAKMVISAVSPKQYPQKALPEIALAGRSNVGKSTFINRMIQRRDIARTSSKPGKTRTINFYNINDAFYLVDVPGYGYAQVSKEEREKWGGMMEEYFETRDTLSAVVIITDSRHEPTTDDVQMYAYLKHLEIPVIVIATKIDKVPKSKRAKYIERTKRSLQLGPDDDLVAFSGTTGEGKDRVWSMLKKYV